jgi:glycosyltransferase involved in cell wall biosynthesis
MTLSVVLPVHNEEQNIERVYQELSQELRTIGQHYEIIFVDDGSKDRSYALLKALAEKDRSVKVVKLISNYGQSTALAAGIEQARGTYIVTMDADGQHDPADIKRLIEPLRNGYHVVCGWRKKRGEMSKSVPSRIANALVRAMTGLKLHDSVGGMKVFRREVTDVVPLYGDMHRYLPVLARWKGFRVTERPIHLRQRSAGKTHYTFKRLFGGFFDLLTVKFFISYSTRPLHIFAAFGLLSFTVGFIIGLYYLFQKIFFGVHLMQEVASLILSVLLIILGINGILFGFIADMVTFDAISSKKRKMYVVEEIITS